jgi:hypothetical protein
MHPDLEAVALALLPPNTDTIESCASLSGSVAPPTSGTHSSGTP